MSLPSTAQSSASILPSEAEARLKHQGVYPTPQRLAIANMLFSRHQHATADQVFERVNQGETRVSRATVYNTLSLFVEKGLLQEICIDAARTFYDSNITYHQHIYNVDSGDLIDINLQLLPLFLEDCLPDGTILEDVDVIVRVRDKRD